MLNRHAFTFPFYAASNPAVRFVFLYPRPLGACSVSRYRDVSAGVYDSAYVHGFLYRLYILNTAFRPFIPGNNAPFPMVIQCNTAHLAQQVANLLQPLVDMHYVLPPARFMNAVSADANWHQVCQLLDGLGLEFFILLRAHRIGIYMDRYVSVIRIQTLSNCITQD